MASTLVTFDAFIKEYYNPQKVEDLTRGGKPFYSRVQKNSEVTGDPWVVPILYGNPQGTSAGTLANAQTGASGTGGNIVSVKWAISMASYFGSVSIGDKVIMASRNNMGSFLQDKTVEIDGLYEQFANDLAMQCWSNGGGATGQIATISGNVLTLVRPQDAFNFEIGEYIGACSDDGTNTGTTPRTGSTYVTAIDRISGAITVNSAAGITSLAALDYIFRLGNVIANTATTIFSGVQAFITTTLAPGTLWGVTRTADIQRLSGSKVPSNLLSGKGIEERIQLLGVLMQGRYRGMGTGNFECYLHPEDWQNLTISVQSRGIRPLEDTDTKFGYQYIEVIAGGKRMKVFSDPYCPKGLAYIMRMDNWTLGSYGELIAPVNGDGLQMLRASTTNDYEFRLKSYPNLVNNAPGFSGVVALP
jgi:hypothetical protein